MAHAHLPIAMEREWVMMNGFDPQVSDRVSGACLSSREALG